MQFRVLQKVKRLQAMVQTLQGDYTRWRLLIGMG